MTDDTTNCLYDEYKALEQSYMSLMDDYSDVARALGFSGGGLFGDVSEPHPAILARARACKAAYDQMKEGRV